MSAGLLLLKPEYVAMYTPIGISSSKEPPLRAASRRSGRAEDTSAGAHSSKSPHGAPQTSTRTDVSILAPRALLFDADHR